MKINDSLQLKRQNFRCEIRKKGIDSLIMSKRKQIMSIIYNKSSNHEYFNILVIEDFRRQFLLNRIQAIKNLRQHSYDKQNITQLCEHIDIINNIVQCLRPQSNNNLELRIQASWAIVNLTACEFKQSEENLLKCNIIQILIQNMKQKNVIPQLTENCTWALNNMVNSREFIRQDLIKKFGVLEKLQNILQLSPSIKQIQIILSIIYKLTNLVDCQYQNFHKILTYIFQSINSQNNKFIILAVNILSKLFLLKQPLPLIYEMKKNKIFKRLIFLVDKFEKTQKYNIALIRIIDRFFQLDYDEAQINKYKFLVCIAKIMKNTSNSKFIGQICYSLQSLLQNKLIIRQFIENQLFIRIVNTFRNCQMNQQLKLISAEVIAQTLKEVDILSNNEVLYAEIYSQLKQFYENQLVPQHLSQLLSECLINLQNLFK